MPITNQSSDFSEFPAVLFGTDIRRHVVDINPSTLWRWVRSGKFPPPITLPSGRSAWRREDVLAWLANLSSDTSRWGEKWKSTTEAVEEENTLPLKKKKPKPATPPTRSRGNE